MDEKEYLIVLEESALIGALIPAIEAAYVSTKTKNQNNFDGHEVGGSLWGSRINRDKKDLITIKYSTCSNKSKSGENYFQYNTKSLNITQNTFHHLWPNLGLMGHFHSHPYMNLGRTEIKKNYYFDPSEADIEAFCQETNCNIELIFTLCKAQSARKVIPGLIGYVEEGTRIDPSCAVFAIGDLGVWIKACMWERDENEEFYLVKNKKIHLHCPTISGMFFSPSESSESFKKIAQN